MGENTHPRALCVCVCVRACVCVCGGRVTPCCQRIKMLVFFLVEAVLPSKALCQCVVAVCCRSDALGILTASLADFVDDPLCFNPELNNRHWVILEQHRCEILEFVHERESLVSVALQGSYGVVKLAYNEDDDKHYVSLCNRFLSLNFFFSFFTFQKTSPWLKPQAQSLEATGELCRISPVLLIFYFVFFKLWAHSPQIASVASEETRVASKVHPRLYYPPSKQSLFVQLWGHLAREIVGYEAARWH